MSKIPFKKAAVFLIVAGIVGYFLAVQIVSSRHPKKFVTIPEGYTVAQIDGLLSKEGIIKEGQLLALKGDDLFGIHPEIKKVLRGKSLEGFLFPDTYEFYLDSRAEVVAEKMIAEFVSKIEPFWGSAEDLYALVTVASIVEKEVPDLKNDRPIVAGIFYKRLDNRMFLQADATICYAKNPLGCGRLEGFDLRLRSAYNTYLYKGLPPGPISNPGKTALFSAAFPEESPYFYYISRPDTKETIFAKDLDEHNQNIVKYLK